MVLSRMRSLATRSSSAVITLVRTDQRTHSPAPHELNESNKDTYGRTESIVRSLRDALRLDVDER